MENACESMDCIEVISSVMQLWRVADATVIVILPSLLNEFLIN